MYRVNVSNGDTIWSRFNVEPWGYYDSPRSLLLTGSGLAFAQCSFIFKTDTAIAYLPILGDKVLVWNEPQAPIAFPYASELCSGVLNGFFSLLPGPVYPLLDPLGNIIFKWVVNLPGVWASVHQRLVAPDSSLIVLAS